MVYSGFSVNLTLPGEILAMFSTVAELVLSPKHC